MVRIEFSVDVDRPPAEVFAYLTDAATLPEWQSTALSAHKLSNGPLQVGAQIADERRFLGRHVESTVEVTEWEPEQLFSLKGTSGPIRFEVRHRLEPRDGRTCVRVEAQGEAVGLSRLAGPLAARTAEHEFKGDFRRLKKILESSRPA